MTMEENSSLDTRTAMMAATVTKEKGRQTRYREGEN